MHCAASTSEDYNNCTVSFIDSSFVGFEIKQFVYDVRLKKCARGEPGLAGVCPSAPLAHVALIATSLKMFLFSRDQKLEQNNVDTRLELHNFMVAL